MIKTEIINEKYIKHYSDADFYIRKTGTEEIYTEAIDLISVIQERGWEYEETDIPIPDSEEPATENDYEEALTQLGVNLQSGAIDNDNEN